MSFSSPGLLIDRRLFANIGRFLIAYLLSKSVNVFVAKKDDVVSKRKTEFKPDHLDDYLFTHLLSEEYDGEGITRAALHQANKTIHNKV